MKNLQEIKELFQLHIEMLMSIQEFYKKEKIDSNLETLRKISLQDNFWQSPEFIQTNKKMTELAEIKDEYERLNKDNNSIKDLLEMFEQDSSTISENDQEELIAEIGRWCKAVKKFKFELLLTGPHDKSNCFLNINPGAGGTESQDWAEILLRMYLRFAEKQKFHSEVLDLQKGGDAGIKSATVYIKGKNAYGLLKNEIGVHRLVRISPFDANKRRHTSFAAVYLSPEVDEGSIEIKPGDLRIDTYRSGGAGGQHVNTTDSAVRITHIPTGAVVQCQNERSQHQNKQKAMKMLYSKLVALDEQKKEEAAAIAAGSKQKIEWGSQIRSYVLHPYKMVKDHRTGETSSQPNLILDGNLEEFIEAKLLGKTNESIDEEIE